MAGPQPRKFSSDGGSEAGVGWVSHWPSRGWCQLLAGWGLRVPRLSRHPSWGWSPCPPTLSAFPQPVPAPGSLESVWQLIWLPTGAKTCAATWVTAPGQAQKPGVGVQGTVLRALRSAGWAPATVTPNREGGGEVDTPHLPSRINRNSLSRGACACLLGLSGQSGQRNRVPDSERLFPSVSG